MVSVIIPTYKRAQYIKRAIESVLNQTYEEFELIIVDDNNPNTKEREELEKIVKEYLKNPKIKFIQHEENKNGAAARNTAIKIAKGEYITFLDDDDFYLKDRLKLLVEALENNLEYDAVYSAGVILYKSIFNATKSGDLQKNVLMQQSFFKTGSNMFFRADTIRKLNGFDEKFRRHQDLEVMVRFFRESKVLAVDKILVVKDNSSRMNELDIERAIEVRNQYLKTFENDINKYNDKNIIMQKNYISLLIEAAKLKDRKYYQLLKEKVLEYGEINIKLKIKLMLYSLFKNSISIKRKMQEIITKIKINQLDKETLTEIKTIIDKSK